MGPLKEGLGETCVGVFDGMTPDKTIKDVYGAIEAAAEFDPDIVVGVGGGSSLDVARQLGVFRADSRTLSAVRSKAESGSTERLNPDGDMLPVVVVPTTFAGASLSNGGSIEVIAADESPTGQPIRIKGSNMPRKLFYDPDLYKTTPPVR